METLIKHNFLTKDWCTPHKVSVEDALQHDFIRAMYLRYTEV